MVDIASENLPTGGPRAGTWTPAWLRLAWLTLASTHLYHPAGQIIQRQKTSLISSRLRLNAEDRRTSIGLPTVLPQNELRAPKHRLYPSKQWCSDIIYLPLRRWSFGEFDPYAPAFKGRLDCETIPHPVNVPFSYSLVQLEIKPTEQACHRNIELRTSETRNLGFVSGGWVCECGYETVLPNMTYLIPIQTRGPRP